MDDRPIDTGALINELEGHLLVEATLGEGRRAAGRFTRRFEWLTDSQREEIEEGFAEQYVALVRDSWGRTARRAAQLRGEYEEVYRGLRRRLLATFLFGIAVLVLVAVLVVAVART